MPFATTSRLRPTKDGYSQSEDASGLHAPAVAVLRAIVKQGPRWIPTPFDV